MGFRLLVALLLAVVIPGGARAADVDARATALAHEVMSPFCPQLVLSDCRTDAAAALRADIRTAMAQGASDAEIRAALVQRFGERILAAPPARGFGLLAWLLPPALVLAGAGVLGRRLLGAARASGAPDGAPPPIPDALRHRLEAELRRP